MRATQWTEAKARFYPPTSCGPASASGDLPRPFADDAREHLASIHRWIAGVATSDDADVLILALIDRCEGLRSNPFIGSPRDDVRPGLRTLSYKRRYTIGYRVDGEMVTVLGIIGRGQQIANLERN